VIANPLIDASNQRVAEHVDANANALRSYVGGFRRRLMTAMSAPNTGSNTIHTMEKVDELKDKHVLALMATYPVQRTVHIQHRYAHQGNIIMVTSRDQRNHCQLFGQTNQPTKHMRCTSPSACHMLCHVSGYQQLGHDVMLSLQQSNHLMLLVHEPIFGYSTK
jgi:hypothetical protein